ncbi:MAG: peptide chain release factor N(5)-glutamine methyltransferase [Vagococcus sp.]
MDKLNTYFEVLKWASSFLNQHEKETYIAEYLLLEKKGWSKTDLLLHFRDAMPETEQKEFQHDLNQILNNVPPQYIIGACDFFGYRFKVNESTLIPRPETEELVSLCLDENDKEGLTVVDVGTGTGAIGLSLKKNRPTWQVSVSDISDKALEITKENANELGVSVEFLLGDTLEPVKNEVDIIISNPPYISIAEWDDMDESVREFEPKLALFAEDDGLAIYKKLAQESVHQLKESGKIYLEIGYLQGEAVKSLFQEVFPRKQVTILKDLNGHDRMIKVS